MVHSGGTCSKAAGIKMANNQMKFILTHARMSVVKELSCKWPWIMSGYDHIRSSLDII